MKEPYENYWRIMKDRKHMHVDPLLPSSDWNIDVVSDPVQCVNTNQVKFNISK